MLTERYPLSRNDQEINRARDLVAKLSDAAGANNNPWHVYVLEDRSVKNAAATRGNFVFVWSGMFDVAQGDDELATVLAHEIGHVLAGHTQPTAEEAVGEILSEVAGGVAGNVVSAQGGYYGLAADLAAVLVSQSIKALIVNPESQRKELEADHIGMFLMADAGFSPQAAISFWERVQSDPAFGTSDALGFFSSHPSSSERIEALRVLVPDAEARYARARGKDSFTMAPVKGDSFAIDPPPLPSLDPAPPRTVAPGAAHHPSPEPLRLEWRVRAFSAQIHTEPYQESPVTSELARGVPVRAVDQRGDWLQIVEPEPGFVRKRDLTPRNP